MRSAIIFVFLFLAWPAWAEDFKSTNFIIRDPIMTVHSGRSTSTNFDVYSSTGGFPLGEASSTNFAVRSGFLYYPIVTSPVLSGTAGQREISLSWTASEVLSGLGWTVNAYQVGQATASGGPYSYTNVGNVLASTRTGLADETAYYFIVRTLDALSHVIATSTQIAVTTLGPAWGGGAGKTQVVLKGDVTGDGKINLIDFSILAYWYKRPLTAAAKQRMDLNGDGVITLVDFSIMAYWWTG